jgi:hypothetical protein
LNLLGPFLSRCVDLFAGEAHVGCGRLRGRPLPTRTLATALDEAASPIIVFVGQPALSARFDEETITAVSHPPVPLALIRR